MGASLCNGPETTYGENCSGAATFCAGDSKNGDESNKGNFPMMKIAVTMTTTTARTTNTTTTVDNEQETSFDRRRD